MSKLERRYISQEFRVSQAGEPTSIGGYAAVFDSNSEDMGFTETIDPHAFDSVMAKNPDVRCLWNHNADHILGRTQSGTLKLSVDARGLAYECQPPDTQFANDLMVSMRRKDITGSSFGFIAKRDQWTEMPDGSIQRRILEFDELLDVSPVTYPAFVAATSGVRALPDSMPVEIRSRFEKKATEKRDNANGCDCQCDPCVADDCMGCDNDECTDPDCLKNQDEATRSKQCKRALGFGCSCACAQCQADACSICSDSDCIDPECASCKQQYSLRCRTLIAIARLRKV
jgi:HK97 family phage prohead protease